MQCKMCALQSRNNTLRYLLLDTGFLLLLCPQQDCLLQHCTVLGMYQTWIFLQHFQHSGEEWDGTCCSLSCSLLEQHRAADNRRVMDIQLGMRWSGLPAKGIFVPSKIGRHRGVSLCLMTGDLKFPCKHPSQPVKQSCSMPGWPASVLPSRPCRSCLCGIYNIQQQYDDS